MSKLKFKASEPFDTTTAPGYGRDESPVKDFAQRNGLEIEYGFPCVDPAAKVVLIDMEDGTKDGRHGVALGVQIEFQAGFMVHNDEKTGMTTVGMLGEEVEDLIRKLRSLISPLREMKSKISQDPQLINYNEM